MDMRYLTAAFCSDDVQRPLFDTKLKVDAVNVKYNADDLSDAELDISC